MNESASESPKKKSLPILGSHNPRTSSVTFPAFGTFFRLALVGVIAAGLRWNQLHHQATFLERTADRFSIESVQDFFPNAVKLAAGEPEGFWKVQDDNKKLVGYVARTLPFSKKIVGYRGPSDLLLCFDSNRTLVQVKLLQSFDTPEHVRKVESSTSFFEQFRGWRVGDESSNRAIDGVSGATLTSFAMAEAVAFRLSGKKRSFRFPDVLTIRDLETLKQMGLEVEQEQLIVSKEQEGFADVLQKNENGKGELVGRLFRTGLGTDAVSGYQGPSEVLLWLDLNNQVRFLALRNSYDNQEYYQRLNWDTYFWEVFQNRTLTEISDLDLAKEEVEGVSGATMTSLAVAKTIVKAAKKSQKKEQRETKEKSLVFRWTVHDVGTGLVLLFAMILSWNRVWRNMVAGRKKLRFAWNLVLIGYFGLVTGNLLSQVVLLGWAASGVAWNLAPGLFSVMVVALLFPVFTKRNIYCSHLCPHGAAQQLLKQRGPALLTLPPGLLRRFLFLPGSLLVFAVVITSFYPTISLTSMEPFHAYLWQVAGWGSLVLAVASLGLSCSNPMVYCRYGCPTGRLLNYVRDSAKSNQWNYGDWVAIGLAAFLWGRVWFLS